MAKKVFVPAGTTEANVGTRLYTADADGIITATDGDALALLGLPGFTADPEPDANEPPPGFVRVVAPEGSAVDGTGALSYGGVTYTIGPDGTVIVPAAAAADLLSHGFTPSVVVPGVDLTADVPAGVVAATDAQAAAAEAAVAAAQAAIDANAAAAAAAATPAAEGA